MLLFLLNVKFFPLALEIPSSRQPFCSEDKLGRDLLSVRGACSFIKQTERSMLGFFSLKGTMGEKNWSSPPSKDAELKLSCVPKSLIKTIYSETCSIVMFPLIDSFPIELT